eukprot:TRINITY_DN36437_c0_g1_i1.p1 TRINITY_DN36437_c0_g1~~TRINITY_DN36437_c0_g1_i1.p1  ORF type:complete len:201 (+),score=64.08 TRINITY_DN36437_c0_g1_i1:39-641(+)
MTSFSWKRKATKNIVNTTRAFEENEQVKEESVDPDFDWMSVAKKQKLEALEDNKALFSRLKQEGVTLAEDEKFWQAISRWDIALSINAEDVTVLEMKAQALINLHEWIVAIKAAEKCVQLKPNWWVGHQTLGRAQMGIGEVKLALRSFQVALHLNPDSEELREDDLRWAVGLLKEKDDKDNTDASQEMEEAKSNSVKFRS